MTDVSFRAGWISSRLSPRSKSLFCADVTTVSPQCVAFIDLNVHVLSQKGGPELRFISVLWFTPSSQLLTDLPVSAALWKDANQDALSKSLIRAALVRGQDGLKRYITILIARENLAPELLFRSSTLLTKVIPMPGRCSCSVYLAEYFSQLICIRFLSLYIIASVPRCPDERSPCLDLGLPHQSPI